VAQNFIATHKPTFGAFQFYGSASAGTNTSFTVLASLTGGDYGGEVDFYDTSAAGGATIINLSDGAYGGYTQFFGQSSAAGATLINKGAPAGDSLGGETVFYDYSSSGNAMIINEGGVSPGYGGGGATWFSTSTAGDATAISNGGTGPNTLGGISRFAGGSPGNATLIALGGTNGGGGGAIDFFNRPPQNTARVELFGNATLFLEVAPIQIGSIEGDGDIPLTQDLTVGANNLSTVFSGLIEGKHSLTKTGTGSLTLTGANTYLGGTTIESGSLVIDNKTGSATGSGSVLVSGGRLVGRGTIAGPVTMGTGSGPGAAITPRKKVGSPDSLVIQGQLTLHSDATYQCRIDSEKAISPKVAANAIVIDGAVLSLLDRDKLPLSNGTVLIVLNNTSSDPISGAFANLPDGGMIAAGNNTFQASYSGGDGNDLTLTVVP
jgi:autotransporter-associated beta strand protein